MRMRGWATAICLWLLCAAGIASAAAPQVPQPRQISVFDGLPSNRINALAEDRQGYLWIATRDGLARYDGVGFRIWRIEDGLRRNFVWSVHVDAQDRVWVGTQGAGLAMLDVQRRRFVYHDRARHPQMGSDDVWSIASTPDGDVWFGTADGGLHRLSPAGRLQRYMPVEGDPRSLPSPSVVQLVADPRGSLWVGTKGGVARWTGRDFERLPRESLPSPLVDGLVLDRGGDLWIGMQGAGAVRRVDGRIQPMPWSDPVQGQPALHMLVQDARGARWLDTRNGLAWSRGGRVHDVPLYSNTSRGVVRPSWSSAYEDREGGLWFGSSDAGLWHLPANWRNFTVLQRRVDDPASPANAYVHGVAPAAADGGRGLWLVGNGGTLDWMDPENGAIEHRLTEVCGSYVSAGVHESADGLVWMGCFGQLVRFDPRSGAVRRWMAGDRADAPPDGMLSQFVATDDGGFWLAGPHGVQRRAAGGAVLDTLERGDGRGIPDGFQVEQLAPAADGGLWLAGSGGLLGWNDGSRRFESVPGAPGYAVYTFAMGRDGTVWLGGAGRLTRYAWDGAALRRTATVDADDGLPDAAPSGLVVDGNDVVWMTSVRGLVRYDPERDRLRIYGVRDGLPSQEFSEYPFRVSPLGYIAAGTADGLLLFHPRHVQWSERTPTLAIESFDLRRGETRMELPRDGALEVRHDDRDLRVVARLLSFTDAHAHRYRFRLGGYDPGWVDVGASGERIFARLAPGAYVLDVQARTADDDWTPSQRLRFRVAPPWWLTGWAHAGAALLGAALLASLAYAYRRRLKRRHAWHLSVQKRALAEQASLAKTRFLATLGHEVRTPMTGVLGMSELLLGTDLDPRQRSYTESIRR
ncbi:MAG TPA: two-component regulator propeller domain-containing protein, partial [Luteimonas sp.]|nr:two-component regulator propeller domain-containing protein [Luteimonas sp.]